MKQQRFSFILLQLLPHGGFFSNRWSRYWKIHHQNGDWNTTPYLGKKSAFGPGNNKLVLCISFVKVFGSGLDRLITTHKVKILVTARLDSQHRRKCVLPSRRSLLRTSGELLLGVLLSHLVRDENGADMDGT